MVSPMGSLNTTSMSSHAKDEMSGMTDDSGTMTMSMADMAMTFFQSIKTPLFSDVWKPHTTGQYAGTCIFLVVLTVIVRVMLALKPTLETCLWQRSPSIPNHAYHHRLEESFECKFLDDSKTSPDQGLLAITGKLRSRWRCWDISSAAMRALYELILAGAGYLLYVLLLFALSCDPLHVSSCSCFNILFGPLLSIAFN